MELPRRASGQDPEGARREFRKGMPKRRCGLWLLGDEMPTCRRGKLAVAAAAAVAALNFTGRMNWEE